MRLHRPNSVFSAPALALLLIGSLSCSGAPSGDSSMGTPRDSGSQSSESFGGAKFKVEAPFSTAVVEIRRDGTVRYEASSSDTGIEKETGSKMVGDDDLSRLMEVIRDAEFFSLAASYPYQEGVSYEDGSTYSIRVSIEEEKKEVTCYEPECPARFDRVMGVIREIWGEEILEVGV